MKHKPLFLNTTRLGEDHYESGTCSIAGTLDATTGVLVSNPTSTITRGLGGTATYAANTLIASSGTAGSIVVPSFTVASGSAGAGQLRRFRLSTNGSGLVTATWKIDFWSAAPIFINGDTGAYVVGTGAALWLGSVSINTFATAFDGSYGVGLPDVGTDIDFALVGANTIFWTLKSVSGFAAINGQTFTGVAELFKSNQ